MAISKARSKRKATGSRYKKSRKKKKHELGSLPTLTKIGNVKLKKIRTLGRNQKLRLLTTNIANVLDRKTNKYKKVKIKGVSETPANRHFVRRNIMTKGCIIDTELGKAKVTSRPGQDGTVNAVMV